MTQLLLRVHFTFLHLKATAWLYGALLSTLTECRKQIDFLRFSWFRRRPDLNGASIARWIGEEASRARSNERLDLRMLLHVTFHFDKSRLSYLSEILRNISSYNLKECRIVVNKNSEKTVDMLRRFNIPGDVVVREDLHHPFMLTWAGRADMARQLKEFDLFMYVEDEILVPFSAVKRWYKGSSSAWGQLEMLVRFVCSTWRLFWPPLTTMYVASCIICPWKSQITCQSNQGPRQLPLNAAWSRNE